MIYCRFNAGPDNRVCYAGNRGSPFGDLACSQSWADEQTQSEEHDPSTPR